MTPIVGHDDQIEEFVTAMRGARMHHAWLFTGPEGLGKASLAKRLGARLLAEAAGLDQTGDPTLLPPDSPTASLIAARSHPDFKLVEREVWQKGQKDRLVPYNERKEDDERSRSIRVVQIRWLEQTLALAPSMSARRVVVIDAADDFERNASNALLKSLEEPPAGTIFLLVSHAPGRLLPTIRSRCRLLRFSPLGDAGMTAVLRAALRGADDKEIAALVRAGEGSPGRALGYAGLDIAAIDAALAEIARTGDPDNRRRATLAKSLALKAAQPRYEAFLARAPAFIAAEARRRGGGAAIDLWSEARTLAGSAVGQSLDAQHVAFQLGSFIARLAHKERTAKG